MRWFELAIAAIFASLFTASHLLPVAWCEPFPVRLFAGIFAVVTGAMYLCLVDDERRPRADAMHRMVVGAGTGVVVATISRGDLELHVLLALAGAMAGWIGFRWFRHVSL